MQVLDLILSHPNFYCPVTGECILNGKDPINDNCPSVMGYWVSECFSEPVLESPLSEDWSNYATTQEGLGEPVGVESLEQFLADYVAPTWVTFCISTIGEACGPSGVTVWLVIDMNASH